MHTLSRKTLPLRSIVDAETTKSIGIQEILRCRQ